MGSPLEIVTSGRANYFMKHLKRKILVELGLGPKRWRDLVKIPEIWALALSEKVLSKALDELQEEGLIKQDRRSHKNRPYSLSGASDKLLSLVALTPLFDFDLTPSGKKALFEFVDKVLGHISEFDTSVKPYAEDWFREEYCTRLFEYYGRSHLNEIKDK